MRVLKIGSMYVTSTGDLSPNQSEALRLADDVDTSTMRAVRMVPHGTGRLAQPDSVDAARRI